jgi:ribonuclease-3
MNAAKPSGIGYADKLDRAERILGYEFNDKELLRAALTHPSALDRPDTMHDYERLEFLGDSILGAISAAYLFDTYRDLDEGGLTRIKVSLVSGTSLSRISSEEGIADCIIFGESETGTDQRGLHSALENVYESLVAALYLDGGVSAARAWIARTLLIHADRNLALEPESPKSSLQEILQDQGRQPVYCIVGSDGPPHARTFFAQVQVDDKIIGEGSGHSKKQAEAAAAQAALKTFKAE